MKKTLLYGGTLSLLTVSLVCGPMTAWADDNTPSFGDSSSSSTNSSSSASSSSETPSLNATKKDAGDDSKSDSKDGSKDSHDNLESVNKDVLSEYGIDLDAVDQAQEVSDKANAAYAKRADEVKKLEESLSDLNDRIKVAESEQKDLVQQAKSLKEQTIQSQQMAGRAAADAYMHGYAGNDVEVDIFDPQALNNLSYLSTAERVMDMQAAKVQDYRTLEAEHANVLARQNAVNDDLNSLKAEASKKLDEAKSKQADAKKLKEEAEAAVKTAQEEQDKARKSYEKAMAEAKAQKEKIAALQEKLMKAEGLKASDFDASDFKLDDADIFPLPRPVSGGRVSSGFGWRKTPPGTIDYGGHGGYVHTGIDYAIACGTQVHAPADGQIVEAGPAGTGGIGVIINHGVVGNFTFATDYHHLSKVLVHVGDKVKKGDVIALSGNTGNSTGCHLHFETVVNGKAVNPVNFLK